jgi:acyl-CoA synthetase (AMP-forming)/AMP-acid ligase II
MVTLSGQSTPAAMRAGFAQALPQTLFLQYYGLTEAFRVLWLQGSDFLEHAQATGRPSPGVKLSLDADGELWVEGPTLAAGYFDDPEETARRFIGGKLRTGDLFERDGDLYRYLGRRDGMFKSYGQKVIPEVIEGVFRTHPAIEACVVVPEETSGELRPMLVAVSRKTAPPVGELLRYARERLPSVMVPARVSFVLELPMTTSGKILRQSVSAKRTI